MRLRTELDALMDADPAHDTGHLLRVALWTWRLAPGVPPRQAIAAALLHDLVNLPKDHEERARASELSSEQARSMLPRAGFDAPEVELICEAIRCHSYSRGETPKSDLGRALQDADRLEALGALGICRTFSTGARLEARYFHPLDPWGEARARDDIRYSIDHFFTKLLGLAKTMLTPGGRREATRRVEFMKSFLVQLGAEIGKPAARHLEVFE